MCMKFRIYARSGVFAMMVCIIESSDFEGVIALALTFISLYPYRHFGVTLIRTDKEKYAKSDPQIGYSIKTKQNKNK